MAASTFKERVEAFHEDAPARAAARAQRSRGRRIRDGLTSFAIVGVLLLIALAVLIFVIGFAISLGKSAAHHWQPLAGVGLALLIVIGLIARARADK